MKVHFCDWDMRLSMGRRNNWYLKGNMRKLRFTIMVFAALAAASLLSVAQQQPAAASQDKSSGSAEASDKAFKAGNDLLEKNKPAEALRRYEEALAVTPDDTSVLFNAGMAAYFSNNLSRAAELWKHLVELDPGDWRARSKLI